MKSRLVSILAELKNGPYQPGEIGWDHDQRIVNCQAAVDAGLSGKNLPLACVAIDLLAARQPDTVRGVMYAVVSAGWLSDTGPKSYGKIQRILNTLRKRDAIPFHWIVDNIRSTEKPSSWSGLADFADTMRDAYRRDFWASLPSYVTLIVEKDTVAGRVAPVTREFDVPLHPLRGFSSTSFAYQIGHSWRDIEKPITVYYIGDHDPSGRMIETNIRTALAEYSGRSFAWKRLAVEPHQFDEFKIIPLAPKKADTRYKKFAAEFGERCAEVEAVPADALRSMVEDAIRSHIPADEWQRLQTIEETERATWHEVMAKIGSAA